MVVSAPVQLFSRHFYAETASLRDCPFQEGVFRLPRVRVGMLKF